MAEMNKDHNRVVWMDIPVADLARASAFYEQVLGLTVHQQAVGEVAFAVLDHGQGNGACLVVQPDRVGTSGPLVYLNVNGRLRAAEAAVSALGGRVEQAIHAIGPHGYRALIIDSEGNRLALHSDTDQ